MPAFCLNASPGGPCCAYSIASCPRIHCASVLSSQNCSIDRRRTWTLWVEIDCPVAAASAVDVFHPCGGALLSRAAQNTLWSGREYQGFEVRTIKVLLISMVRIVIRMIILITIKNNNNSNNKNNNNKKKKNNNNNNNRNDNNNNNSDSNKNNKSTGSSRGCLFAREGFPRQVQAAGRMEDAWNAHGIIWSVRCSTRSRTRALNLCFLDSHSPRMEVEVQCA